MDVKALLDAMHVAERLKNTVRHCDTSGGHRETVAEHCWRAALMALFMKDEFPDADMNRVIEMVLIHDLGEAFTGDIPTFNKTEADEKKEEELLYAWVDSLPEPLSSEMRALYAEMEARETVEARIYKSIDGLEALIQHNESDIATWLPLEYDLQRTYAFDRVTFSDYLTAFRREVLRETEEKIAREGKTE